jgi:hypothetical protein
MKKMNPNATSLVRGFLLGSLYEKGHVITTQRIRREMMVSPATAKRDMAQLAKLVSVTPSKPITNLKNHMPRKALKAAA